jgi:hypothetical protein
LRTIVTNQSCIHEEIESKLNLENNCCHSLQFLLSSRLLSKNINIEIYKKTTLPVILYGCQTCSLTPRQEHRLRVCENRVLRIFEPKRKKVAGSWRRPHNDELHYMYTSPNIIQVIKSRRVRRARHVALMREMRYAYNT